MWEMWTGFVWPLIGRCCKCMASGATVTGILGKKKISVTLKVAAK